MMSVAGSFRSIYSSWYLPYGGYVTPQNLDNCPNQAFALRTPFPGILSVIAIYVTSLSNLCTFIDLLDLET